jgi:spermidine/putrescine-binding protein
MLRTKWFALAIVFGSSFLLITCGKSDPGAANSRFTPGHAEEKVVNLFIWSDYLAPDTISSFEKQTGIKVHVAYFDTNETLETRMLTGHTGFDVVVPSAAYFQRQIRSGAYLPLDKKQLANLTDLDPLLMSRAALYDPGNTYGVVNTWGTFGIGYNETLAIPKDAPHVVNAHRFINYVMEPHVMANISNSTGFANASTAALLLLDPSMASDTAVYPTLDQQQQLIVQLEDPPEQARAITRIWQKFKTGQ